MQLRPVYIPPRRMAAVLDSRRATPFYPFQFAVFTCVRACCYANLRDSTVTRGGERTTNVSRETS